MSPWEMPFISLEFVLVSRENLKLGLQLGLALEQNNELSFKVHHVLNKERVLGQFTPGSVRNAWRCNGL